MNRFPRARHMVAGLIVAGFALVQPALSGAPSALAAEIAGTIVEGASGRGVAGLDVLLVWRSTQEEAGQATSDAQGRFRFANVDPGPYLVTATYQGVPYVKADVVVAAESSRMTVDLDVFETTTADDDILIRADHLILQTTGADINVTEVLIFENTGDRTYIGAVSPASPTGYGMFVSLPDGYIDLTAPPWLERRFYSPSESGFHMALPLQPGTAQVTLSYRLQRSALGTALDRKFPFDVRALNVAVPTRADLRVRSAQLHREKPVQIDGRWFALSSGGPFAREALVRARAWSGLWARGFSARQTIWGACGLFTLVLGLFWIARKGRQLGPQPAAGGAP
ncbi:MAG: carboxypeptidase-like regulatory domain-containing protein [Myxococcota bacterium]